MPACFKRDASCFNDDIALISLTDYSIVTVTRLRCRLYKNVPKIYMPMFWFDLKVKVTEEMAANLKQLLALPTVILCGGITIAVIGLCLIAGVVLLYLWRKHHILRTISTVHALEKCSCFFNREIF